MILDGAVIQVMENNQGVQEKDINRNNQGIQEKDIDRNNQGVQEKEINRKFSYDYHWCSNNNSNSFCYSFNLVAFLAVDIGQDICARYPDLLTNTAPNGCVLVTKKTPVMDPTAGPVYAPQLLITPSLHLAEYYLEFQVFFKSIFHESYTMEAVDKYLQTMKVKLSVLAFPSCLVKLVLSLRNTKNGQYLLYVMTVLIVSYGTNLALRDLLMTHCMIAVHHASCCGTI